MTSQINLGAAYSYIIIQLALKYVEINDTDGKFKSASIQEKFEEFNRKNDFGFEKTSLFPFLLTVANGTKETLLDFFNMKFEPVSYGIIHTELNDFISSLIPLDSSEKIFDISYSSTTIFIEKFQDMDYESNHIQNVIEQWLETYGNKIFKDKFSGWTELLAENSKRKMFEFKNVYALLDHGISCFTHKFKDFPHSPLIVLSNWTLSTMAFNNNYGYQDNLERDLFYKKFNAAIQIEKYEFI